MPAPVSKVAFVSTVKRQEGESAETRNYVKFVAMKPVEGAAQRRPLLLSNNGEPYMSKELLEVVEKRIGKSVTQITITVEVN